MRHDAREWVTEGIMTKTPVVFVEGHDDIQFYSELCRRIGRQITVEAVENVEGYHGGSNGVINCIMDLQELIEEKQDNVGYVLGIIDRDARFYRGEVPNLTALFILKKYSYESHFTTSYVLTQLIKNTTYAPESLINVQTLGYVEDGVKYEELYYASLEALKNACTPGYDALVCYDDKAPNIFNHETKISDILRRKSELDQFAHEKNISINDVKLIAKGKWLLYIYCKGVWDKIQSLYQLCSSGLINQCNYCRAGTPDNCLWKSKIHYQIGQLQNVILNYIDENEVEYIKERLKMLA